MSAHKKKLFYNIVEWNIKYSDKSLTYHTIQMKCNRFNKQISQYVPFVALLNGLDVVYRNPYNT